MKKTFLILMFVFLNNIYGQNPRTYINRVGIDSLIAFRIDSSWTIVLGHADGKDSIMVNGYFTADSLLRFITNIGDTTGLGSKLGTGTIIRYNNNLYYKSSSGWKNLIETGNNTSLDSLGGYYYSDYLRYNVKDTVDSQFYFLDLKAAKFDIDTIYGADTIYSANFTGDVFQFSNTHNTSILDSVRTLIDTSDVDGLFAFIKSVKVDNAIYSDSSGVANKADSSLSVDNNLLTLENITTQGDSTGNRIVTNNIISTDSAYYIRKIAKKSELIDPPTDYGAIILDNETDSLWIRYNSNWYNLMSVGNGGGGGSGSVVSPLVVPYYDLKLDTGLTIGTNDHFDISWNNLRELIITPSNGYTGTPQRGNFFWEYQVLTSVTNSDSIVFQATDNIADSTKANIKFTVYEVNIETGDTTKLDNSDFNYASSGNVWYTINLNNLTGLIQGDLLLLRFEIYINGDYATYLRRTKYYVH